MEFESQLREKEKEREKLEDRINKQDQDVSSYLQLIEVKDESIVKLSNKLDELELAVKIDKASSPPIVGEILTFQQNVTSCCSFLLANGSSYFSGYVEKVGVGSQTENDKEKEHLEDMVTAFQMQNKFLNKVKLQLVLCIDIRRN